jgi:hypothetical protein
MTSYRVNVSLPMLEVQPWRTAEGWRITKVGEIRPGCHSVICTCEDDGAPPELEGALVVPHFRWHGDGTITVISRELVA